MGVIVLPFLRDVTDYFQLDQAPAPQSARAPSGGFYGGIATGLHVPLVLGSALGSGGVGTSAIVTDASMYRAVRQGNQEDRDDSRATTAAVVGGIGAILISGLSALFCRTWCNDRKALERAIEFKNNVLLYPGITDEFRTELIPIANKYVEVLEAKTSRSRNIVIVTALALGAAIAGFIGGMMSLKWLITAAIISAVAILAIAAFMIVWHCTDQTELPPEMARKVATLRQELESQRV